MRVYVSVCDKCGSMSVVPDDTAKAAIEGQDVDEKEPPMIGRCAIVYELDSGEESCSGDSHLRGVINLADLT